MRSLLEYLLVISGLFIFQKTAYSQVAKNPVEVTATIKEKIRKDIEVEADSFKQKLTKRGGNETSIEFTIDTFRIEEYLGKYIGYDWSDAGMLKATYEASSMYDSLLNKYYKKLLGRLKASDKQTLIQAEKSWIAYRDNEEKLIGTTGKDEYSGGGTMQQLIDAIEYLDLIRERTVNLYRYYLRASGEF